MSQTRATLVLLSRVPRLGESKTRLAAATDRPTALRFHLASLTDLLRRFSAAAVTRRVLAWSTAPRPADLLPVVPGAWETAVQVGDDLGERMGRLAALHLREGPVLFIGSDSPTQPVGAIAEAMALLSDGRDAVFQPARDGGYVLAGFATAPGPLLTGIPWGSDEVLTTTLDRAETFGLTVGLLEPWYDVDTVADLEALRLDPAMTASETPAIRRFLHDLETQR